MILAWLVLLPFIAGVLAWTSGRWSDTWPPLREAMAGAPDLLTQLPRAVEFRVVTGDYGEIAGVVELVSSWPSQAVP